MRSRSLTRRHRLGFAGFFAAALLVASCATQPAPNAYNPPGFWLGLLHGFLIFFSFIGSLFTDHRIYAFPNSGVWYDFGYFLGASLFLGGGGGATSHLTDERTELDDFDDEDAEELGVP